MCSNLILFIGINLFFVFFGSCDDDGKLWTSQFGDQIRSYASNHATGVVVLFNKFKGDVMYENLSKEARWIILVLRVNNVILVY